MSDHDLNPAFAFSFGLGFSGAGLGFSGATSGAGVTAAGTVLGSWLLS